MRRVVSLVAVLAALFLTACDLPDRDRVQQDLQAIADAGAAPEAVTVEVTGASRGEGDMQAFDQHVKYDLKVWRDGQLIGPLVGGIVDARAGRHLTGGELVLTYQRVGDTWSIGGINVTKPPSSDQS